MGGAGPGKIDLNVRVSTLDDLLISVYSRLIKKGRVVIPSKGKTRELTGASLELSNPRARMSRSEERHLLFSCLGEFLWYLSGGNSLDFIRYYIKNYTADGEGITTVRAAYGPRLRGGKDQLLWIIELLRQKPDSRRAVIPIFSESDTFTDLPEVPCTCTLQFLIRKDRLEMITHMRSNDVYLGLPGDVFAFTMIQELVARSLNIEVGTYKHLVGSLHLYEKNRNAAERFLDEGWQRKQSMPPMPLGDQFQNLEHLLQAEESLRTGKDATTPECLPDYWQDLIQLLRIFRAHKQNASSEVINALSAKMHSDSYQT
jgi:thymidylate synthase